MLILEATHDAYVKSHNLIPDPELSLKDHSLILKCITMENSTSLKVTQPAIPIMPTSLWISPGDGMLTTEKFP